MVRTAFSGSSSCAIDGCCQLATSEASIKEGVHQCCEANPCQRQ